MSLLSRFFGGGQDERDEPASMRRILAELRGLEPERARFLAAFAYLLARVAHADLQVGDDEVAEMERTLVRLADLQEAEARLVVRIAVHQAVAVGGTDDYIVTREFRRMSDKGERLRLIRSVLAVAAADDVITSAETREIAAIGEELGLTRPEVNALRLEHRDKLAELK
jgi:uncharacterized tellurite resistance protein B-like protein